MRLATLCLVCLVVMGCSERKKTGPPPGYVPGGMGGTMDGKKMDMPGGAMPGMGGGGGGGGGMMGGMMAGGPAGAPQPTPVPLEAGVGTLSPDNTMLEFIGTHVGEDPNPRRGLFSDFTGTVEVDPETNVVKSASVDIKTESLWTATDALTNHLTSTDFFDVREFPSAKFESTSITVADEGEYTITGNLTLLETTKEISFPATVEITEEGLKLDAELTIDRTEFGMDFGLDRVEPEVELVVSIGEKTEKGQAGGFGGFGGGRGGRGGGGGGGFDPAAIFARRDADGDGKLAGDEIGEFMRNSLAEIDTDEDGAVSLEEFQARMQSFGGGRGGGGFGGRGGGGGGFDPAAFFARMDADGDGLLVGDEISERMRPNLEEIDTDGDGAVSLDEFRARMESRFGGRRGGGGSGRPQRPATEDDAPAAEAEETPAKEARAEPAEAAPAPTESDAPAEADAPAAAESDAPAEAEAADATE